MWRFRRGIFEHSLPEQKHLSQFVSHIFTIQEQRQKLTRICSPSLIVHSLILASKLCEILVHYRFLPFSYREVVWESSSRKICSSLGHALSRADECNTGKTWSLVSDFFEVRRMTKTDYGHDGKVGANFELHETPCRTYKPDISAKNTTSNILDWLLRLRHQKRIGSILLVQWVACTNYTALYAKNKH